MSVNVYSTNCPKCRILMNKLASEGIPFSVCEDINVMQSMGIMSVPVLEVDGEKFSFALAINKIKELVKMWRSQNGN